MKRQPIARPPDVPRSLQWPVFALWVLWRGVLWLGGWLWSLVRK